MTALTVKQLISKLKKFPPDAVVAFADHDHSDDEMNSVIGQVIEASSYLEEKRGIGVILRN